MNPESLKHRGTEAAEEIEKLVNSSAADFLISSAVGALVCSCSRKADAQAQSSLRRVAEDMEINEISSQILAAAFKVHTAIGPGVLESVYQTCLHHELRKAGLGVEAQVAVPVHYDGLRMESGYRIDLLVEDTVIVEIKCVDALLPIHKAQLLTYLKLANKPLGLLLNFNVGPHA